MVSRPILVGSDVDSTQPRRLDRVDRSFGIPQNRKIGQIIHARPRKQRVNLEDFLHRRPPGLDVHQRS